MSPGCACASVGRLLKVICERGCGFLCANNCTIIEASLFAPRLRGHTDGNLQTPRGRLRAEAQSGCSLSQCRRCIRLGEPLGCRGSRAAFGSTCWVSGPRRGLSSQRCNAAVELQATSCTVIRKQIKYAGWRGEGGGNPDGSFSK